MNNLALLEYQRLPIVAAVAVAAEVEGSFDWADYSTVQFHQLLGWVDFASLHQDWIVLQGWPVVTVAIHVVAVENPEKVDRLYEVKLVWH